MAHHIFEALFFDRLVYPTSDSFIMERDDRWSDRRHRGVEGGPAKTRRKMKKKDERND